MKKDIEGFFSSPFFAAIKTNDVNIPEKVPNRTEIDTDNILKVLFYVIFIIPVLKL